MSGRGYLVLLKRLAISLCVWDQVFAMSRCRRVLHCKRDPAMAAARAVSPAASKSHELAQLECDLDQLTARRAHRRLAHLAPIL